MRLMLEPGLRDFENRMKQAEYASCQLVKIKVAIDFLLLEIKQEDEDVKEFASEIKVDNILYH